MEPKVTGLSPMTGPPGSKITVRGENLGTSGSDIIELTINGADCLPYLEWVSPKKIITRCTKIYGSGDVIVVTRSGGPGSCEVQFHCHEQVVTSNEESNIWVDEIDPPEKDTYSTPGPVGEYFSSRFKPEYHLMKEYSDASQSDLQSLLDKLRTKLANRDNLETIDSDTSRAALFKANLPIIMECLQILEKLSKFIYTTPTDDIVRSIRDSLESTRELFDPLFKQNNIVQSIESAMQIFRRNDGTLFDLPSAMKEKNYDHLVKEISDVISRSKMVNIDPVLRSKIDHDLASNVERLATNIESQLYESFRSADGRRDIGEVKRLMMHLNKLKPSCQIDAWVAIENISKSFESTLCEKFHYYLKLSLEEAVKTTRETPPVVEFIQCAIKMFDGTYYDILSLGRSYFDPKDEFACPEDFVSHRLAEFNEHIVSKPIHHLCNLLGLALLIRSDDTSILWPEHEDQKEVYMKWLHHVLGKEWLRVILNSVISCHINLMKTEPSVSDRLTEFVQELRRQSMEFLFKNATIINKSLHHKEDWVVEVDDQFGSVTKLPLIFEATVIDVLRFTKDVILKKSRPDEESILKNKARQAETKELACGLINSFHVSLDNALSSSEDHPAEAKLFLYAARGSTRVPTQQTNRLLITICNYQFTKNRVFTILKQEFKRLLELDVEKVFEECTRKYRGYIDKAMERLIVIKSQELLSEKSSLLNGLKKNEIPEVNFDLQLNLMITNSQIFLIAPQLVDDLMPEIINRVIENKKNNRVRL